MRLEDGPAGTRKLSRAFRAAHCTQLTAAGYDRRSARGVDEWAAALLAHNLLLRGGELGRPQERDFDATRDITWSSLQWMEPSAASKGYPWLLVSIVGIKDQQARNPAVSMPVRRRRMGGVMGVDPLCTYDALRAAWMTRVEQ
eukprot:6080172-Pleurochrysis_carterae.AAC.1